MKMFLESGVRSEMFIQTFIQTFHTWETKACYHSIKSRYFCFLEEDMCFICTGLGSPEWKSHTHSIWLPPASYPTFKSSTKRQETKTGNLLIKADPFRGLALHHSAENHWALEHHQNTGIDLTERKGPAFPFLTKLGRTVTLSQWGREGGTSHALPHPPIYFSISAQDQTA